MSHDQSEHIHLSQLQSIINTLCEDINRDIETLQDRIKENKGALLGLATLITRINESLTPAAVDAEVVQEMDPLSGGHEHSAPV